MPEFVIERRNPKALKNHPLNLKIYGDTVEQDYVDLIRANGVTTPLVILPDGTVVEGHRRRQAAVICGIESVAVVVLHELKDPLLIERRLILGNKYREKTNEQKAREYERLKEIEAELAKKRQATTQPKPGEKVGSKVVQNSAPPKKQAENANSGKARQIAAEAVGISHDTAEKALAVVHKIDEAEAQGDTETASELRETLNTSVAAAVRKVQEPADESVYDDLKRAVSDDMVPVFEAMQEFKALNRKLGGLRNDAKALCDGPGGVEMKAQWQAFEAHVKNAQSVLKFATPFTECPRCKRKPKDKCDVCRGHGFIVKGQERRLTDADRAWLGAG